jgi:hypothetical protein
MNDSLGAYLKRERKPAVFLSRTWPGRLISARPGFAPLEENRFDLFSQIEYVPGYLKLYSTHLGLNYQTSSLAPRKNSLNSR